MYYKAGYRQYLYMLQASTSTLTEIESGFGSAGTVTAGSVVTVGSGTHSGQSVYKVDLTFTMPGTYQRGYVTVEIAFGGGYPSKWFSSANTAAELDTWASTNGAAYHFKTLTPSMMKGNYTEI